LIGQVVTEKKVNLLQDSLKLDGILITILIFILGINITRIIFFGNLIEEFFLNSLNFFLENFFRTAKLFSSLLYIFIFKFELELILFKTILVVSGFSSLIVQLHCEIQHFSFQQGILLLDVLNERVGILELELCLLKCFEVLVCGELCFLEAQIHVIQLSHLLALDGFDRAKFGTEVQELLLEFIPR
jgi:hypothetical protein